MSVMKEKSRNSKKSSVIRVGDRVRIKAATEFVRCGYSKTLNDESIRVYEKYKDKIDKFVKEFIKEDQDRGNFSDSWTNQRVANALAYGVIALQSKRSGNVRRLFLKPLNTWYKFKGEEATVLETKIVKTGQLQPSYSNTYTGWYGTEYDYEPAYLAQDKTYKVLKVRTDKCWEDFWILQMHVEKVYEEKASR